MPFGLNVIDLFLLLLVLSSTVRGCMRGLRAVVIELAALLGGLYAALRLYQTVGDELASWLPLPAGLLDPIAFIFVMSITSAGISLIGRLLLAPRLRLPAPSLPGAVAGMLAGLVSAALVSALLLALPLPGPVTLAATQSRFAPLLAAPALEVRAVISAH